MSLPIVLGSFVGAIVGAVLAYIVWRLWRELLRTVYVGKRAMKPIGEQE